MVNYKKDLFIILASILAISGAAVAARYLREIHAARETLGSLGSQVIETACGPIEYARVGSGYPLLAVHGAMGGFDAGLQLAQPAVDAGYQVISISRFGYIRTPLPENASVDKQAEAYACLLDVLGIERAAVMTASAGATSSIRFAERYPERVSALILVSPAAPGEVYVAPPPRLIFDTLMRSDFVWWAFVTYFRSTAQTVIGVPNGFSLSPALEAEIKDILVKTLPLSRRINGFIFDNYGITSDFYAEILETSPYPLSKIRTPTLVINALDDPYAIPKNVRGLAEKIPHAKLCIVPDGGHILLGHARDVNAEIIQFLNSHTE